MIANATRIALLGGLHPRARVPGLTRQRPTPARLCGGDRLQMARGARDDQDGTRVRWSGVLGGRAADTRGALGFLRREWRVGVPVGGHCVRSGELVKL